MKKLTTRFPFMTPNTYLANLIAILDTDKKNTRNWIYKNTLLPFVQLDCNYQLRLSGLGGENFPWISTPWINCPFLEIFHFDFETINAKWDCVACLIEESINNNRFVYLPVNTKHIADYGVNCNYYHEGFISGYDTNKKEFLYFDFFNGIYQGKNITYDQVKNAYNSCAKQSHPFNGIYLWGFRQWSDLDGVVCNPNDFTITQYKLLLEQYMNNESIFSLNSDNKIFVGIKVYDLLVELINGNNYIHVTFQYLYLHKVVFLECAKTFLEKNDKTEFFYVRYLELIDNMVILKNYYLKNFYYVNKCGNMDSQIIDNRVRVISLINTIKMKDIELTQQLLRLLSG